MSSHSKIVPVPALPAGAVLIDTHCHLDMEAYGADLEVVLERAAAAGVTRIVTVGIDAASSRRAVALAERFPGVYATVGIHPHHSGELTETDLDTLKAIAGHPKVVAWGEVGMDLVKNYAPVAVQREQFVRQVALARDLNLPLVVHDRGAHAEVMETLRSFAPFPRGGVMHCFSGDVELARQVLDLGFFLSIPGVVTFGNAETLREVVRYVPLSQMLLETDGPYLAPQPRRGRRNEPFYLLYTAQKVAEVKGVSLAEVARETTAAACRVFRLPEAGAA